MTPAARDDRYALHRNESPGAADLVIAGAPLPLAGALRVYTCGITPYDVTHLGHAATFVWPDLLASLARHVGVRPVMSRNVTDVDDVLDAAAQQRQRRSEELAATQEFAFERDMTALAMARPEATPRARAHVGQVIQVVEGLLALNHAYEVDGVVFFRAPDHIHAGLSEQEARASFAEFDDGVDAGRRTPWDVAIWKASDADQPAWPSPWGWGRPAWHVECAAMAATVFGSAVDVLVGGADLCFPHHAYQAAMLEALSGQAPFARRTMHIGTVCHEGIKMAKSTGNLVLVRDLLAQSSGAALRLLLLDRRWSEEWDYRSEELTRAETTLESLHQAAGRSGNDGADAVIAALLADLDVPQAIRIAQESGGIAARTLIDVLRLR